MVFNDVSFTFLLARRDFLVAISMRSSFVGRLRVKNDCDPRSKLMMAVQLALAYLLALSADPCPLCPCALGGSWLVIATRLIEVEGIAKRLVERIPGKEWSLARRLLGPRSYWRDWSLKERRASSSSNGDP